VKRTVQAMLAAYKRWISPALPNACRFVPTCSEYAMEAVELHGTVRGILLATGRLLRCHPLARGGHDPVPQMSWRKEAVNTLGGEDFASGHDLGHAERPC
jgi:putative membrane protein insertion efficiency factor